MEETGNWICKGMAVGHTEDSNVSSSEGIHLPWFEDTSLPNLFALYDISFLT
jgi:hypothetical protein